MRNSLTFAAILAAAISGITSSEQLLAKPSLAGHGGAGGGRPAMAGGGGMSRPAGGGMSRPAGGGGMSRPSGGPANISRPGGGSLGGASRPSFSGTRPATPNLTRPSSPNLSNRPSLGGMPGIADRPNTRPSLPNVGNQPSLRPPGQLKPAIRPGDLAGNRPNIDRPSIDRPNLGNRPNIDRPNIDRPNLGTRPGISTLPGLVDRPSIGTLPERPGIGDITNRPGFGDGNRPNLGIGARPLPERPNISTRPDRPIIGGGNGNIVIGGGNNINIGNGNRPWNGNRPDWGWGHQGNWADHWHDHNINVHYHGWYHGCWHGGYWGSAWYSPFAVGATYWGLSSLTGWGYAPVYYNPYYISTPASAYDYSQPVVINNYVSSDASGGTTNVQNSAQATANQQAADLIDSALALFKAKNYKQALAKCDAAMKKAPGDSVVHEVRALCLFALGDYTPAAAALNSLLAVAPGMDWTTMSGLYPDNDTYSQQLRALEAHCRANLKDSAAAFVLAYHYTVLGEDEAAASTLRAVLKLQPKDAVAQRLLDSLTPPAEEARPVSSDPNSTVKVQEFASPPRTDLVGQWEATTGKTTIRLTIDDASQFTWKATTSGKAPIEIAGQVAATSDQLILETKEQGSMTGRVQSNGGDKFTFMLAGAPSTDPGLAFTRQK